MFAGSADVLVRNEREARNEPVTRLCPKCRRDKRYGTGRRQRPGSFLEITRLLAQAVPYQIDSSTTIYTSCAWPTNKYFAPVGALRTGASALPAAGCVRSHRPGTFRARECLIKKCGGERQ